MMKNMVNIICNVTKKRVFLILIALIILIIMIVLLIINVVPKRLDDILEENQYKLVTEYKAGSKMGEVTLPRNTIKYTNDEISIMIYEFNNIEEIKKEGKTIYNRYKDNIGFTTKFIEEDKYIYICACDSQQCFYTLGYGNELLQSIVNIKLKKETDEIYNSIIKEKKLD